MTDTTTAAPTEQTAPDGHEPETDLQPSTAMAVVAPTAEQALAHAVGDALMPGVPSHDEFVTLAMTARILAMSGAAPSEVRNNPYVAFHVAMVGRDLGISPSAALSLIDVIKSSNGPQISLSPQLLNGQVERLGLGSIIPAVRTLERAVAVALAPGGKFDQRCSSTYPEHREGCDCVGIIGDSEFTWDDARMASLVGPRCQPGAHDPACTSKQNGMRCNQGYITYPKRMLWWRAAGFCADDWFPTASLGLYSPEALGAVVDIEGRPIDPSTVELPEGYQPVPPKADPRDALLPDDEREAYRARIGSLPVAAKPQLVERWKATNEEGIVFLPVLDECKLRHKAKIEGLVADFERRARKGEWGDWTPPAPPETDPPAGDGDGTATTAPDSPSPAPDGPEATDTPDAAQATTEAASGAPDAPVADAAPVDKAYEQDMIELDAILAVLTAEGRAAFTERMAELSITSDDLTDHAKRRQALAVADDLRENPPAPACSLCRHEAGGDVILVEHHGKLRCGDVRACTKRVEAKAAENVGEGGQGTLV